MCFLQKVLSTASVALNSGNLSRLPDQALDADSGLEKASPLSVQADIEITSGLLFSNSRSARSFCVVAG